MLPSRKKLVPALAVAVVVALVALASCAVPVPYRDLEASPRSDCVDIYRAADTDAARIRDEAKDPAKANCWKAAWEHHADYDLFTIEFDDQGWLAKAAEKPELAKKQIAQITSFLEDKVGKEQTPLSMVLFTHGWHHSAAPDDDNVISFRKLLGDMAFVETQLCREKRDPRRLRSPAECTSLEQQPVRNIEKVRRVVGIYVGWRGDSIDLPVLKHLSIWDRKLTAEKVALGSVQELYAAVHDFWRAHACHLEDTPRDECVDVRLLTIGHSFGGLITYRGLAPRLMEGIVERYRNFGLKENEIPYAYGYGNLSVLINPAFEGTRFEPLARAASLRSYEPGNADGRTAQLPFLIVAQSTGDVPTEIFFPAFRYVTTLLEDTAGEGIEKQANVKTVGWNRRYVTHELKLEAQDACDLGADPGTPQKLERERQLSIGWLNNRFKDFNADELRFCGALRLAKVDDDSSKLPLCRPDFLPLWVIQTDTAVIKDHGDLLNPHFLDFVRQVYFTVELAIDAYRVQKKPAAKPAVQAAARIPEPACPNLARRSSGSR